MEQIDLNQIKLEDTGIFEKGEHSFCFAFSKYGITTVGQVLDDNLIKELLQKCQRKSRKELIGFVSLLNYKYRGIPLTNDNRLEKTRYEIGYYDFHELGLTQTHRNIIWDNYSWTPKKSVIDLFKEISNDKKLHYTNPALMEILNLYIESYDKSKQLTQPTSIKEAQPEDKTPSQQEHDILVILKDQLVKLVGVRDSLDAQIEDLQQKIDALTNSKIEGGVSK